MSKKNKFRWLLIEGEEGEEPEMLCYTELNKEEIKKAIKFWEKHMLALRIGSVGRPSRVKGYATLIRQHPERAEELLKQAKIVLSRTGYWRLRKLLNLP